MPTQRHRAAAAAVAVVFFSLSLLGSWLWSTTLSFFFAEAKEEEHDNKDQKGITGNNLLPSLFREQLEHLAAASEITADDASRKRLPCKDNLLFLSVGTMRQTN